MTAPWTQSTGLPGFIALVLPVKRVDWLRSLCKEAGVPAPVVRSTSDGMASCTVREKDVAELLKLARERRLNGARGKARAEVKGS